MQQQLGETIRKYRKQKRYTMAELAEKLGMSIGLLSNIETGKTNSLQLTLLNDIVRELDIPISELELFSEPYTIEKNNPNITEDFNKIRPSLDMLINSFIKISSALDFDENKVALLANMLVKELQAISTLIKTDKSQ